MAAIANREVSNTMSRWRIDVCYDGTAYEGWQVQPGRQTVQGEVEKALSTLGGAPVKVHASGRTDSGVHARLQVVHADIEKPLAPERVRRSMNALMPPDIRVSRARVVAPDFHARRGVREKEYRYFIWNAEVMPPFLRRYRLHVTHPLDVKAMCEAAALLVGRHDFASFTANPNREVASTVRALSRLNVRKRGPEIVVTAAGEGFLYKMVRSLTGFLLNVGVGNMSPADAIRILGERTRTAHVETAPPQGLFLWNVRY